MAIACADVEKPCFAMGEFIPFDHLNGCSHLSTICSNLENLAKLRHYSWMFHCMCIQPKFLPLNRAENIPITFISLLLFSRHTG
jgi:hypothetical protein